MAGDSRHREYSLILAVVAAGVLMAVGTPTNLGLLAVLEVFAIGSILYSAFSVVRHADVLAHRFGEPYGSLILSLSIVVLEAGLISILMLSGAAGPALLRDTIYSVIIIVMTGLIGFSLWLGGEKYDSQHYNLTGIGHFLISIIPLALIVFALPTALGTTGFSTGQLTVVSVCCLIVYIAFLRIQTVTHRDFFVYEDEDEDSDHHATLSPHSTAWHFCFLCIHLIAVIVVTKFNSAPMYDLLGRFNAPEAFSGFLVALLILSPEGAGAFRSVLQNKVQRAMNLLLGSVLATISLTIPLVALIVFLTNQELILGLDMPSILLLIMTFMVCQGSLTGGKTNAHSGTAHIILFIVYIMLLF